MTRKPGDLPSDMLDRAGCTGRLETHMSPIPMVAVVNRPVASGPL